MVDPWTPNRHLHTISFTTQIHRHHNKLTQNPMVQIQMVAEELANQKWHQIIIQKGIRF